MAFDKIKTLNSLIIVLPVKYNHFHNFFHFRDKGQGPKFYPEKDLQSGEHRLAPDHHQSDRNQRTSLRRLRIQSCQLSGIFTEAKLIQRPRHTVSLVDEMTRVTQL